MKRLFQARKAWIRVNEDSMEVTICPVTRQFIMMLITLHQNIAQTADHHRGRAQSTGILQKLNQLAGKLFSAKWKQFDEEDFRHRRTESFAHDLLAKPLRLTDAVAVIAAEKLHLSIEPQWWEIYDLDPFGRVLSLRHRPAVQEDNVKMVCESFRHGERAYEMPHAQRVLAIEKNPLALAH
jgi:hypothetical protein